MSIGLRATMGSGDMLKLNYDVDDNSIVDSAEVVSSSIAISKDSNSSIFSYLENINSGSNAAITFAVRNTVFAGNGALGLTVLGTGWTNIGAYKQNWGSVDTADGLDGLSVITNKSGAPIEFYTGGLSNLRMTIEAAGDITLADGNGLNLQEDITFLGATTENLILFPDNLADALSFQEGANKYLTFVSTNSSEKITTPVQIESTLATGTSPLSVVSTTVVANLNVDQVDGKDETDFALLVGRSGGQVLIGGTASGDDLKLQSSSHGTKGKIIFGAAGNSVYDEVNDRLGIGITNPSTDLQVSKAGTYLGGSAYYNTGITPDVSDKGLIFGYDASGIIGLIGAAGVAGSLTFWTHSGTAWGERVRLSAAGNLGIGVSDPDTRLEVFNAGDQLKLSFDAIDNCTFAVDTAGDLTITPSGAQVIFTNAVQIDGNFDHDGSNIGFFGTVPVSQAAAITQTYSTADSTHAARTAPGAGAGSGADATTFSGAECDALVADQQDTAALLNDVIDKLQAYGLLQ